jgi:flagellar basal-body rod modification protein FlgD
MSLTIGQSTNAQPTQTTAASGASATTAASTAALSQDQFLQLLVAQLQNQDPMQPMEGTEFVTQLAQFSQVEQAVAQSQQLTTLTAQVTGLSNDQTTALVGKTVTISGNSIAFDGSVATPSNVTLGAPASQVTATITDSSGNVVRTLNLGAHGAGAMNVPWDGRNDQGQPVPKGSYSLNVSATDANGQPVSVSQNVTGVVTLVSFDQGYPQLTLASGAQAPVSNLVSVGAPPASP